MYETASLPEATYLLAKGHSPSSLRANGHTFIVFEFSSVTEQQALSLFSGPEFSTCEAYHRALRMLRQRMDSVQGAGFNGGRR